MVEGLLTGAEALGDKTCGLTPNIVKLMQQCFQTDYIKNKVRTLQTCNDPTCPISSPISILQEVPVIHQSGPDNPEGVW